MSASAAKPDAPEPTAPPSIEPAKERAAPERLVSLDIYRGATMLLMASDGLHIPKVARNIRESIGESPFWNFLAYHTDHVAWGGCSLWDLIQPSFMFMVGVSLPYSIASRRARGDSFGAMFAHAALRSLILIALAIFLSSIWDKRTQFIFTNVLAQIGLGYTFLFLLGWAEWRWQLAAAFAILLMYWASFALHPLPPEGFDRVSVGLTPDWALKHDYAGFAAHWNKNANFAADFDRWFLNLFPRESPWEFSKGGYATLNFIPSLATMTFGLLAGGILRDAGRGSARKFRLLLIAGVAGLLAGYALDRAGLCPSVKRIWTPSWALLSSGWAFLFLASFYWIADMQGWRRWAFPLIVVGMNSIAMYMLAHWKHGIRAGVHTHIGEKNLAFAGAAYAPLVEQILILAAMWLIVFWMYRRKLFLRI